jgi:hypothetical protein
MSRNGSQERYKTFGKGRNTVQNYRPDFPLPEIVLSILQRAQASFTAFLDANISSCSVIIQT